jgi:hypothetical protein
MQIHHDATLESSTSYLRLRSLGKGLTLLLFLGFFSASTPIEKGTTVGATGSGGYTEHIYVRSSGCSSGAKEYVRTGIQAYELRVAHQTKSGLTLDGAVGYTHEENVKVIERDVPEENELASLFWPSSPSSPIRDYESLRFRIGYQGEWIGFDAGPFLRTRITEDLHYSPR